jgi:hypothetical protein
MYRSGKLDLDAQTLMAWMHLDVKLPAAEAKLGAVRQPDAPAPLQNAMPGSAGIPTQTSAIRWFRRPTSRCRAPSPPRDRASDDGCFQVTLGRVLSVVRLL